MIIKVKKRYVLLLEVIIALLLIVMCIIPLISPHAFILKTQRTFIHEIELDHQVNLIYADLVKDLYRNEISWEEIINQREFTIDIPLPYRGSYRFGKPTLKKPKTEAPYTLYLFPLEITFSSTNPKESKDLTYHYDLFMIRDLAEEGVTFPQGETEEDEDDENPAEEEES